MATAASSNQVRTTNGILNGDQRSGAVTGRTPVDRDSVPDPKTALKGVLNLESGVFHDKTVEQLPIVVHEFVQPTQHTIINEHITREIHTHDVFHRILPVIDLEILPTKHYLADPKTPGVLREISAAEAPLKNNWSINHHITTTPQGSVATNNLHAENLSGLLHRAHEKASPVLSSKKSYMTKEGYMKTEYVWRHPPTLDWSAYDRGETVPLRMSCMDEARFSDVLVGQPNHARSTAEKGISASQGTYGQGVEVPALQKQAYSTLQGHHTTFHTPTSGLASLDDQRAEFHQSSSAAPVPGARAASQASTAGGAIAAAGERSAGETSSRVPGRGSHVHSSSIGTGGAGKFEGGVGSDYAEPGTTLGDHLHGDRNRGLGGGAGADVPLAGAGSGHEKHNLLHKEPPASHPGSGMFAHGHTTREAYDPAAVSRNAAQTSASNDRAAQQELSVDEATQKIGNMHFGKIVD